MARVDPDNNDIVVWKLDEATAPFINSSTSNLGVAPGSTANLTTLATSLTQGKEDPIRQVCGPYGPGSYGLMFLGTNSRARVDGANAFQPQPPITLSMWMKLQGRQPTGYTMHFLQKQHSINVWSGRFTDIGMNDVVYNGDPLAFEGGCTTTGNIGHGARASATKRLQLGRWSHVGLTISASILMKVYINGMQVAQDGPSGVTAIDYDATASSGPWFLGAIPGGSGATEPAWATYADVRIANIVREQPYFQNIYEQGMLTRTVTGGLT